MAYIALVQLALLYLAFLAAVVVRRMVRGPLCPEWTRQQETVVRFIRWLTRRWFRHGAATLRDRIDRLPTPLGRLGARVRLERLDAGGVPAEWITPRGSAEGAPVLYYLHGGGYVLCSVATHRHLIARLALRAEARALAPEYRLGPEHRFPAAVDDAVTGYRWLLQRHAAHRIVIAGDSAGGGLALATLLALKRAGDPLPAGAALLSAWVDLGAEAGRDASLTENAGFDYLEPGGLQQMARLYLGNADPGDPLASPVHGDLRRLPPLLLQVGGLELLRDQNQRLARRARNAGVQVDLQLYPAMVHVWHAFGSVFQPQTGAAIKELVRFVRACTGGTSAAEGAKAAEPAS